MLPQNPDPDTLRILFLADTHLGFDWVDHPRVQRRRRWHDFAANFRRAMEPAVQGFADLVIHGGDLFHRSRVPGSVADETFQVFQLVADRNVPVFIVPGNHERARIPYGLLARHPNIHLFDRPRTFSVTRNGATAVLAGFPFIRHGIRDRFTQLLQDTDCAGVPGDALFLCMHQTVEGACVGAQNYVFRHGPDIIRGQDIPGGFTAVLSGHIHRSQTLTADLRGRAMASPVLYPGAIERTAWAEREETKGYLTGLLRKDRRTDAPQSSIQWAFRPLPARPMVRLDLDGAFSRAGDIRDAVSAFLQQQPPNAIVYIRLPEPPTELLLNTVTSRMLRDLAPPTMNIEFRSPESGS